MRRVRMNTNQNFTPHGMIRHGKDAEVVMMICTAGHVDHGKTELVRVLTGCNTDRLKEEQERGMTIELGFAPCCLGGNLCAGIVDVPGHEKLVRNMVAGVSGIDLALLVVAADDGVMPQTVEHTRILQLLGVPHGIVALTKSDLATPDEIARRTGEIRDFLHGTFMENAPICPVSSRTLAGYEEFYAALVRASASAIHTRNTGLFRMPVERAFSRQGFGTVIAGIPLAGSIRVGDEVELVPGDIRGRVRGIERFLSKADEGGSGQCLALNIPELSLEDALRGRVLAVPGTARPAGIFHVRISTVSGLTAPLKNAAEIRFHTGTAEENARIYLLEDKFIGPDASAPATIVLTAPLAAAVGDRFIIRRPSPPSTIGGGRILAVCRAPHRPPRKQTMEQLHRLETALGGLDISDPAAVSRRLDCLLRHDYPAGTRLPDMATSLQLPVETVRAALTELAGAGKALLLERDCCIHTRAYDELLANTEMQLRKMTEQDGTLSADISALRGKCKCPEPVFNRLLEDLQAGKTVIRRGGRLVMADTADKLPAADRDLLERISALYDQTGFQSPRPDQVPSLLRADSAATAKILDYLYAEGSLVRLSANVVLSGKAFRKAEAMAVEIIRRDGMLDSADFKYRIASSRKYALAILDYLDARKVTVRTGNIRKLALEYQK